jgi:GTP cyclohydrolase I
MSLRGARATGATTLTTVLRGRLREDPASRAEFLALTRDRSYR